MDDDTGLCVCVNPTPGPGEKGWVGPNCEIGEFACHSDLLSRPVKTVSAESIGILTGHFVL